MIRQKGTLAQAKREEEASHNRCAKLKTLTESLCDGCWELFPALDESKFSRQALNTCVNCGLSLSKSLEVLGLPPRSQETDALNHAERTCKAAEAALKNEPYSPYEANRYPYGYHRIRGHNSMVTPSWEHDDPYSRHGHHNNLLRPQSAPFHNNGDCTKSKQELLRLAELQKSRAQEKVNYANKCIENWTKYYNQHKEQLEKVNKTLVDVEEEERKILELKLSRLSGGKRGRNSCAECNICMERTNDTVFQCGHQCCSECAWKITNCHTCRAFILMRIKVHNG